MFFMVKTLYNFNMDKELIDKVDEVIAKSNNKYKDRTQFVILAIQDLIKKEVSEDGNDYRTDG